MEESRGIGGQAIVDERTGGKDMRLLRRAIRNKWPITDEQRQMIIDKMMSIVTRDGVDDRAAIQAGKVVEAADAINAKREATEAGVDGGTSVNIDNNVTVISWEPLGERADAPDPVEAKIAALKAIANGTNGVANANGIKESE